jgi:hypothetical protein
VLGVFAVAAGQSRYMSPEEIQELPDCEDGLMEPQTLAYLAAEYGRKGDSAFNWYCPFETPPTVWRMDICRSLGSFENYKRRVFTCMPWEVDPVLRRWAVNPVFADGFAADISDDGTFWGREKTGMWHLRAQFASFKPVRQWYETGPLKEQSARVSKCENSLEAISFSGGACWHADAEVVSLKPKYKFAVTSGEREFCVLSNEKGSSASYRSDALTYVAPSQDRASTRCKYYGDKIDWDNGGLVKYGTGVDWNYKDVQVFDYRLVSSNPACPDSVTESCVDNAFSFYAKECVWVRTTSKATPLSLAALLAFRVSLDKESFESYADSGQYALNLGQRNIEAWLNGEKWNGQAKYIDVNTAKLYFTEKLDFSCNGCAKPGQALSPSANVDKCGVPQACVTCEPWQRVDSPWRGSWSRCDPSFAVRKCADCVAHQVRSVAETERADEYCVPCPPLTPMRQVRQATCAACNHTQWFDAATALGCAWFVSVVDGLSFTGSPRFSQAYVDRYRPPGSATIPEPVPALHYRSLVSDGNAWTTSTVAERCAPSSFAVLNASAARIFTRNVYPRRVQFRRWCGHAEILKADDALVLPIDCDSRRNASAVPLSALITGAEGVYVLAKERRLVRNRMAEIKLTMLSDGFSCMFELRREGRAEDCTSCAGTRYAKDCGPTYFAELEAPAVAGPGTCEECVTQCSIVQTPNSYFAVTQFSCWSNGTARVQSSSGHGSLKLIKETMSASMNYWYKPAACLPCARLSAAAVPQIVTRCGNKASFETWDPTLKSLDEAQVARPQARFCCALDRNSNVGSICRPTESELGLATATPLCETVVPDLQTEYVNFCPPNWFLDRTGECVGVLTAWKRSCCKECELCSGAGRIKTDVYAQCSGGTDFDTQLKGCVASCAEKNYEFNGTCIACESCA